MSLIVGITGGIGSGKSALTGYLEAQGITVVDADVVARQVVEPGSTALATIKERFGPEILLDDGQLNRAALRKIVFADPAQRHWLEALTHPLIRAELARQLERSTSPYTVLSSPLLLESGQSDYAEIVVVVDVSVATQIARTMQRDNNDREQVERIIAAQMDRETRCAKADIVIDNDGSLEDLHRQAEQLHERLLIAATDKH